jgi:hypothetical protein
MSAGNKATSYESIVVVRTAALVPDSQFEAEGKKWYVTSIIFLRWSLLLPERFNIHCLLARPQRKQRSSLPARTS